MVSQPVYTNNQVIAANVRDGRSNALGVVPDRERELGFVGDHTYRIRRVVCIPKRYRLRKGRRSDLVSLYERPVQKYRRCAAIQQRIDGRASMLTR